MKSAAAFRVLICRCAAAACHLAARAQDAEETSASGLKSWSKRFVAVPPENYHGAPWHVVRATADNHIRVALTWKHRERDTHGHATGET